MNDVADGKGADIWMVGVCVYGAVVFNVNNRLLQDSHSLNYIMITLTVLSSGAFFIVFWIVNLFEKDELYGQF